MGRLDGKVVLITGGALGIGRAACLMAAREGARVVVTDIREEEGVDVADEITTGGGRALFLRHDVSVEEDWRLVMDEAIGEFGRIDAVVNNAGILIGGTVEETTVETWHRVMAVNLDGVFLGTKHGILAMKDQGSGSIINLSSIEGLIGDAGLAAYDASKGGVRLLTKSAALHCAEAGHNIRVNSIHPGAIRTRMLERFLDQQDDAEEARRDLVALHPLGRLGEPDDIAYGVVFLASDESSFITGTELVIDGGYTAR